MPKKSSVPTDKPLYPTQSTATYPMQSAQPPAYGAPAPMATGAPPPYSQMPTNAAGVPMGVPYAAPQPFYPQFNPQQSVIVQGGFDAGARFDGNSRAVIPPPPPGCMPNAAQMAAAQGCNLVVTQRPSEFFTGGSDGGYTWF